MSAKFSVHIPTWNIYQMNGYTPQTTLWQDFWIAAQFGTDAVKNTYDKVLAEWKDNHIYMTELALVLNHLGWTYHQTNDNLASRFFELWDDHTDWCYENLKGDELDYFMRVVD